MSTEIQQAESRIASLKEELNKARQHLNEVVNSLDFPRGASKYWYLRNDGEIWYVCWAMFGGGSKLCQRRRAAGNCYRTEQEAQEVAELRNTLTSKIDGWV